MLRRMSERHDTDAGKSATAVPDPGSEGQWFGFKPVDPKEKAGLVRQVFDSVADAARFACERLAPTVAVPPDWEAYGLGKITPQYINDRTCQDHIPDIRLADNQDTFRLGSF